jgi:periplasmic copper chaperone A
MKHTTRLILASLLAFCFAGPAPAQTSTQNAIIVDHPWARATPRGAKTGAVYLSVINKGSAADRLLSATTPVADKVQFHSVSEENGISHMREMHALDIAPGGKVTFSPGGMHIMLVGLKHPLKQGETFPITLTFEKAGKRELTVPIAGVGAMQGGDMPAMMYGHEMAK